MEENMNMSAERSLKIITEQIERNRKAVSKDVGESLYMAGICTMTMAVVVAIVNGTAMKYGFSGVGHLLWFLLPLIIWGVEKYRHKDRPATPPNIISTLVAKTWVTFGIFTLAFFFFATLFNNIVVRTETIEVFRVILINPLRIIVLLMGMAITITGYILKQRWLVWCGIIGGVGGFFWETVGVSSFFISRLGSIEVMCYLYELLSSIIIVLFGFVGLFLPGYIIKKQVD